MLSVISYWEVVLKTAKGKLDVGDPAAWWETALSDLAAAAIPLRPLHVAEIRGLPAFRNDPFDRALIARATAEGLVLVTTDQTMARYASNRMRVVR